VTYGSSAPAAPLGITQCNGTQAQQWIPTSFFSEGPATLLVVTDATMQAEAQKLVDHKNATGMPAAVVTWQDEDNLFCHGGLCDPSLGDLPAILKKTIDYYYRYRGTKYVFLAGDDTHVPVRFTMVHDDTSSDTATSAPRTSITRIFTRISAAPTSLLNFRRGTLITTGSTTSRRFARRRRSGIQITSTVTPMSPSAGST
jgi:hypothetical protein